MKELQTYKLDCYKDLSPLPLLVQGKLLDLLPFTLKFMESRPKLWVTFFSWAPEISELAWVQGSLRFFKSCLWEFLGSQNLFIFLNSTNFLNANYVPDILLGTKNAVVTTDKTLFCSKVGAGKAKNKWINKLKSNMTGDNKSYREKWINVKGNTYLKPNLRIDSMTGIKLWRSEALKRGGCLCLNT